jgi:hypothetical protein
MNEINATAMQSIGDEINLFVRHIDSLRETLPMTMVLIQEVGKESSRELTAFESENCTVTIEGDMRRVAIPLEHSRRWKKLRSRHDQAELAHKLVPRSMMVSLVSQYDAFLGRLLRAIFLAKPELLNNSEKTLSFSQVASFPSIQSIRDHVVEKEIEAVLRTSHSDQIKWMENRFGLPLTKGLALWPQFIELTERRNLFVHTDGVVSSQYLSVCEQHGVPLDPKTKEGGRLNVSQKYFGQCYCCIFELGVKLGHVLWRKLLPTEREAADGNLISATYELIDRDDNDLALALLDFACGSFKTFASEWFQLALTINRAQAYKWSGKKAECVDVLNSVDWSAKGDEFKLGAAALREDWTKAVEIMRRIGINGPVSKLNYRDWPLFRELRCQPEFLEAYEEIFTEPFPSTVSAPPEHDEESPET